MTSCRHALVVFALGALAPLLAQTDSPPVRRIPGVVAKEAALRERLASPVASLDLDLVMLGEDFYGAEPRQVRWSADGRSILFDWKRWNDTERATFRYDVADRELTRIDENEARVEIGVTDRAQRWRAYRHGHGLFLEELDTGIVREIWRSTESVFAVQFSTDGRHLSFATHRGFFLGRVPSGPWTQVLSIESGAPPTDDATEPDVATLPGWHRWRELELFRRHYEADRLRRRESAAAKAREVEMPKVTRWWPKEGWAYARGLISGDGRCAVLMSNKGKSGTPTVMPDYVTVSGYTETRSTRPKVGDAEPESRSELVDLTTGTSVDILPPDLRADATWQSFVFSADGSGLLGVARTPDDRAVFVAQIDQATGGCRVLHFTLDAAWVQGSEFHRPIYLGTGKDAVFLSEASGYAHLYRIETELGSVRALTAGSFEISAPVVSSDGRTIHALSSERSPHVRDLVAIDAETGAMRRVSSDLGGRRCEISPDGRFVAETFSQSNRPWELRLWSLEDPTGEPVVVTDSPSVAWKSQTFEDPEIITFPASDGAAVPARIYRPETPHPSRPAIVFVHGAGYLQNVHRWWSTYSREYGFHHILKAAGYVVLDVDYRGSAGYGRDWRTAIYGHMGGRDLLDFVDAARYLVEHEGVAKDRIGIYGGSYGGFITLMALFKHPGVFAAGAALRPVTDWAHYNEGYTSNILDDPLESPLHYARSSPIEFAEGLEDHLLICHGILDDNVHVQDVFRLQQRLIELRKSKWEVAYYPLEGHGFLDAASWSDEYRRIRELFARVLER